MLIHAPHQSDALVLGIQTQLLCVWHVFHSIELQRPPFFVADHAEASLAVAGLSRTLQQFAAVLCSGPSFPGIFLFPLLAGCPLCPFGTHHLVSLYLGHM